MKCLARKPWFLTCSNLLVKPAITVTCCFISFMVIIMNFLSLIVQRYSHQKNLEKSKGYGMLVVFINISDISCAIYLHILWIADLYHKGSYVIRETIWRSGIMCHMAFAIIWNYGFLSPFLLSFFCNCQ